MENISIWDIFPALGQIFQGELKFTLARLIIILLGILFIYAGYKKILEPLLMIPMGLGMLFVNAGVLIMPGGQIGTLFVNSLVEEPSKVIDALQIYFLQPIYTLGFSNELIACLVFAGIGSMTDLDFLIARPLLSLLLAVAAEFGTLFTLPIAVAFGFTFKEAAAISIVGGADSPIVLFTSLMLAKHLFVIITVVAYLYLSLAYALFPYLIKFTIPKKMRGLEMDIIEVTQISSKEKFAFAIVAGLILSLLFPVAAPLFASFFLGVAVKEADIPRYKKFFDEVILTGSTLFLGFVLGVLLDANVVMSPSVFLIMLLGMLALILSAIGGLIGGVIAYKLSNKKINPLLGIAAVSCVPVCATVAQRCASEVNPRAFILTHAMGPNVAGVITTAIICACYLSIIPLIG
jgi:oxaloacetate decarboxylase beta subunit